MLKKCLKVSAIRKALKALPKGLDDTYTQILINIDQDYREEAVKALLWLAFSERPLEIRELAEAMVLNPQSRLSFDPNERFHDPRMILQILPSLVAISPESSGYELHASEKISLAHFSVKEFLLSERIQHSMAKAFALTKTSSERHIAESSIQYILHYASSAFKTMTLKDLDAFPLLQYACQFWHHHVQMTTVEDQNQMEPIIFEIFASEAVFLSWLRILRRIVPLALGLMSLHDIGTPLFHASDIGLAAIVDRLLKQGADVQARTNTGGTALHRAAMRGHSRVVQLLIENGAPVNAMTTSGETPLHRDAEKGHVEIVELLLANGADIELENSGGWTALQFAAYHVNENAAQILVSEGANIEASNASGQTALHWAAYKQHASMLDLLIKKGANINARNIAGETATHYAARLGHLSIISQLLEKGAEVDARTNKGETALHWAAIVRSEETARLLLEFGTQVDAKDDDGETALHMAGTNGGEEIARLLLEFGAQVDAKDAGRETALFKASKYGHYDVKRLLLDSGAQPEPDIGMVAYKMKSVSLDSRTYPTDI
jgi:ankyrin repeat protein